MNTTTYKPQFDRKRYYSLYNRGAADSYYHRPRDPHWYREDSYNGEVIYDLTADEIAEYNTGYYDNENSGNKKNWDV